jgi:methionyl-tRNA formyltransferase
MIRYIFAGNRFFVLEQMLRMNLPVVQIFALRGSFLERELLTRGLPFENIPDKSGFVRSLKTLDFDIFVSNGCPVILPISDLTVGNGKRFINVHPSLLPDLRGRDPVPGAILYGLSSGATCHVMDDGIDSGAIIAQVSIEMTADLDCGLLYQLSFIAEQMVFVNAFNRDFKPLQLQSERGNATHYTRKEADLEIDLDEDAEAICRRIRAFNSRSQGAFFIHKQKRFVVRDCEIIKNAFMLDQFSNAVENQVALNYEQKIVLKKGPVLLKLKQISGDDIDCIKPGDVISP